MKKIILAFAVIAFFYNIECNKSIAQKSYRISHQVSYRPLYHFTTDSNWINDPNGLLFFNGQYHLFAQYNPFGDKWGHMSWAHAISNDLFTWNELPVAIPEMKNADSTATMIFSGSAVVDSFNTSAFAKDGQMPLVAIYTSHHDKNGQGIGQSQSLAFSLDEGETWQQYANNPVLDIHITDFRDPKVFWYAQEKKWIMAVVKALEYKVQFYESADLKKWNLMSEFGGIGNVDKIWECPDLFQLPIENGNEKKWVLTLSAGHPQKDYLAVQYFIGNFDGKTFTADKLNYPLYIDHGKDFYAGITYNNLPVSDGRVIMLGWANCWNYANEIPTKGFRGMYTVPRSLSLRNTAEGLRLMQQPVIELNKHTQNLYSNSAIDLNNTSKILNSAKGTSLDISFNIQADAGSIAGINLFKSGNEETTISYNNDTKIISLDRTRSGDTSFHSGFASIETVNIYPSEKKIKLRILIDKSIVELFINDGEYVITDQVFPKHTDGGVELFSKNGKTIFSDLTISQVLKTIH